VPADTAEGACVRARVCVRACTILGFTKLGDDACMHAALALPHLLRRRGAASVASFLAAVVTEIYLCNVCSCQEILRRNGRG
jgi:hypothetical protein